MSRKVFLKSLDYALDNGQTISIGGGEPTCHPKFWEFIGLMLAKVYGYEHFGEEFIPWMAINGKNKKDSIRLANMAKRGIIQVELSRDQWHEEIDEEVVRAFDKKKVSSYERDPNDFRRIRTNRNVIYAGRAIRLGIGTEFNCPCDDLFVDPIGNLFACGCKNKRFGTIFNPEIPEKHFERENGCCYTNWERKESRAYL